MNRLAGLTTPSQIHPKRPRRVTLFSLAVLLLGSGLNLTRAAWAWYQADALTALSVSASISVSISMPMDLLAVTSLVWGIIFGVCGSGLWRLHPWGRKGTLIAVTVFHGHIWFNHVLFDRSDYARQIWPFAIVHTLTTLFIVWGFLYWPSVRCLYERDKSF